MEKEIKNTGIFECEDRMFMCAEYDGNVYVAEVLIVSPRDEKETTGVQAFNELQDAGILDE